jgi:ABC-type branched-subunit amino acid transport system substrate-binding protein
VVGLMGHRIARASAAAAMVSVGLAACGGGSSADSAGGPAGATLTVATLYAYTGDNADNGSTGSAGCLAGVQVVNAAGGVLGHRLRCQAFDTKSDPADAVPAANQMLASASNLVMVIGPSDEAPATVPIVTAAKIPNFATVGDPNFDTLTDPYFYRLTPSDSAQGYALGYYGAKQGYLHAASVFTNDLGAQTSVPTLRQRYTALGGRLAADLTLAPGQASYRTEAASVLAAHPDAIFTEMDPRSASTFLSQLLQLGGSLPPVISTQRANEGDWVGAVAQAVGPAKFQQSIRTVAPYVDPSGTAYDLYKTTLMSLGAQIKQPEQYAVHSYTIADYDAVSIMALAMIEARSTSPTDYRPYIRKVTAASTGATVAHTYAEASRALSDGRTIQYVGASGVLALDRYQSAPRSFGVFQYASADQAMHAATVIPGAAITGGSTGG